MIVLLLLIPSPSIPMAVSNLGQWSGRFLGMITGWDPSVCKSNQLHVDILRFSFIELGYILRIPLKCSVIFLQSWTSTGYFSNSIGSYVTNWWFSLMIDLGGAPEGRFTHHEIGPWKMAFFHGPTSMIWFLKKKAYKAFVALTTLNMILSVTYCSELHVPDYFYY